MLYYGKRESKGAGVRTRGKERCMEQCAGARTYGSDGASEDHVTRARRGIA